MSEIFAAPRGGASSSWIELVNASAEELELLGVGVRMRRLDGGAEQRLLVRRSLVVGPGEPVVLSQSADEEPAFARYGFAPDAPAPFYAAGAMMVESCEGELDRITYSRLPAEGSLSLGEWPPSADTNDRPGAWCVDRQGSPAERNAPCR